MNAAQAALAREPHFRAVQLYCDCTCPPHKRCL